MTLPSKVMRLQAAELCAIAAGSSDEGIQSAARHMDYENAVGLALEAQARACATLPKSKRDGYEDTYAEAEAMLRNMEYP